MPRISITTFALILSHLHCILSSHFSLHNLAKEVLSEAPSRCRQTGNGEESFRIVRISQPSSPETGWMDLVILMAL